MNGCPMFQGGKYREPEGSHIVRIAKRSGEAGRVITRELELGVRNPEGAWVWLCGERRELKPLGRFVTNREMCIYFKYCSVAK